MDSQVKLIRSGQVWMIVIVTAQVILNYGLSGKTHPLWPGMDDCDS